MALEEPVGRPDVRGRPRPIDVVKTVKAPGRTSILPTLRSGARGVLSTDPRW